MRADRGRTPGFTLIELLVVIGVIAVLAGIGLVVGRGVLNSGRDQLTRNTITIVETILTDLESETDLRPRDYEFYRAPDPATRGATIELPMIDAREDGAGTDASTPAEPSLGRFLKFAEERVPSLASRWTQLDPALVQSTNVGRPGDGIIGSELLDAWGNPIRFVHPSFDGGYGNFDGPGGGSRAPLTLPVNGSDVDYRRSFKPDSAQGTIGDADEGICPSGRPYAYSAGADGDPGTRGDNVYGDVKPTYPAETRDLGSVD